LDRDVGSYDTMLRSREGDEIEAEEAKRNIGCSIFRKFLRAGD